MRYREAMEFVFQWVSTYGYGALFVLLMLGIVGLPVPDETLLVFCGYLILTGVARFLIEFIRINPPSFFGLSNAQAASLVSILIGVILLWRIRSGAVPKPASV